MKLDALEWTLLFDYYGDLLTERQQTCFDLYYNQDLSLGEIAEEAGISRQGVYDTIARAKASLKTMEDKTFEGYLAELAEYEEWYNAWQPKINEYYATTPNPTWEGAQEYAGPNRWPEPLGPKSPFRPSGLYETMIKRVCPYTTSFLRLS